MFTGIIEELGVVEAIAKSSGSLKLSITGEKTAHGLKTGDSVAVSGACLTAVKVSGSVMTFDVVRETLQKTNLGSLKQGGRVNLETSLAAGAGLSGHFVLGHVDDVARVISRSEKRDGAVFEFGIPEGLGPLIVPKGSVALDGVSLTVAEKSQGSFSVSFIPHTLEVTTFGKSRAGDLVNVEVDMLGKYVHSFLEKSEGGVTKDLLRRTGFTA